MTDYQGDRKSTGSEAGLSLENQFLIAMPHLQDPNFNGSVTYLWKHSDEGALGVVINHPSDITVTALLAELNIEPAAEQANILQSEKVLHGGPVERNKGFILHSSEKEWDYTIPITDDVSISMSPDIMRAIAEGEGPEKYLVALGCAGWEAGQLEQEISDNVWLTVPMSNELLFSRDYENKAAAAAAILGVELSQLSSFAGHS